MTRSVRSLLSRSIALLRATRVIQAPGIVGRAVSRPPLERDDEGLLHRLLGEVEVAEDADQARDRPPRLVPEQAIDELIGRFAQERAAAASPDGGGSTPADS